MQYGSQNWSKEIQRKGKKLIFSINIKEMFRAWSEPFKDFYAVTLNKRDRKRINEIIKKNSNIGK